MKETSPVGLVVGGSRGIGRQVAIDLAGYERTLTAIDRHGYTVVVAAKSRSDANKTLPWPPNPNSQQSTISTVVREIRESGGKAEEIVVDVRDHDSIKNMVDFTVKKFGHLDVLVYNSGAIWWSSVENTPLKRFQLMQKVNPEGLYSTIQAALPYWANQAWKARIVVVSPPIYSRFFRGKTAYAMGKIGMSVLTKGLAMDWLREGKSDMAITSIWPAVAIESAATQKSSIDRSELRNATIFSDAILAILFSPTAEVNGSLLLDEDFLRTKGVKDFSKYALVPGSSPLRIMPKDLPDLTVAEQDDEGKRMDSSGAVDKSKI